MHLAEIPGMCICVVAPEDTHNRNVSEQQPVHLNRWYAAAGKADDQNAAFLRNAFRREVKDIAAYGIEDDVSSAALGQFANLLGPVVLAVIDRAFRALAYGEIEFRRLTRRCDNARAQRPADLNC